MADTDLIERLTLHAASWRRDDAFKARDPEAEAAIAEEAATALAEKDAQYERLAGRMGAMAADNQRLRAECEGLRAKLNACHWFWPEDDTSSEMCGESAQEIVQNAYDWAPEEAGNVVAVARGGIVKVTYCASLPPADDADSDDDFWVEEQTREAAQTKIDAEKARRAALSQKEAGDVE